jgi:superfamily I DNA/RNA helicase
VLPQHILCITFTNKAAEELQTRLQQAMQEARALAAAAAGAQQQQQQQPADEDDVGYSGVLACTFHSWCYRLLRRYFRVSRHDAAIKKLCMFVAREGKQRGSPLS